MCVFFLIDVFANQDVFADADVFFSVIWNAIDVSFSLAEIFDEQMRVVIGQIVEYNSRELWLFELENAFSVAGSAILTRVMAVVFYFVKVAFVIFFIK